PAFTSSLRESHFMKYLTTESFRRKMILVLWEPPIVYEHNWIVEYHRYFAKVLTWCDDLLGDEHYVKFQVPQPDRRYPRLPFEQKRTCVLINSNLHSTHILELYSERRRAIRFFEQQHPAAFDLYGKRWDATEYPSYRGIASDKGEMLQRYR